MEKQTEYTKVTITKNSETVTVEHSERIADSVRRGKKEPESERRCYDCQHLGEFPSQPGICALGYTPNIPVSQWPDSRCSKWELQEGEGD